MLQNIQTCHFLTATGWEYPMFKLQTISANKKAAFKTPETPVWESY